MSVGGLQQVFQEVDSGGCPISYSLVGRGRPVLLVMGLGAASDAWQDHVGAWAEAFSCVLVDNRGAGRSGKPAGPYSTSSMADDCARVLESVADEPAAVIGLSMGGAIAQELALGYPQLVRRLVLVSSWARCDNYLSEIIEHLCVGHEKLDASEFAQLLQLRIWSPDYISEHLGELRAARRLAGEAATPHHAFAAQCGACASHDSLDRLEEIAVPTLITAGRDDGFTALQHAEQMQRAIRGSCLDVFPGGHAHHWENLDAFNERVLAWLSEDLEARGCSVSFGSAEARSK